MADTAELPESKNLRGRFFGRLLRVCDCTGISVELGYGLVSTADTDMLRQHVRPRVSGFYCSPYAALRSLVDHVLGKMTPVERLAYQDAQFAGIEALPVVSANLEHLGLDPNAIAVVMHNEFAAFYPFNRERRVAPALLFDHFGELKSYWRNRIDVTGRYVQPYDLVETLKKVRTKLWRTRLWTRLKRVKARTAAEVQREFAEVRSRIGKRRDRSPIELAPSECPPAVNCSSRWRAISSKH